MKALFLTAFVVISMNAISQYSQWTYGFTSSNSNDKALNGAVLHYTDSGHIMAGTSMNTSTNAYNVYVVKNDLNGNSTIAPYFNKAFRLRDAQGFPLKVMSSKVVELKNGTGYALGGVAQKVNNAYVLFYLRLNPNGSIGTSASYTLTANIPYMDFGNIRENAAGTALYLVGQISPPSPFNPTAGHYFIHKIDQLGNVIWSKIYAFSGTIQYPWIKAHDVTEDTAGTELAIVGTLELPSRDGFFTKVNPNTGIPAFAALNVYGLNNSTDELYSITYSRSHPQNQPRYLVAGMSDSAGNLDAWMMLLDQSGNALWSTLSDDGNLNEDNGAGQIIERRNTSGILEYYTIGATRGGAFGGIDVHMIRGAVSTGIPNLHYVYGDSMDDACSGIDFNNGSPGSGLAFFGSTKSFLALGGIQKVYFLKTYFNGAVGCNSENVTFTYAASLHFREIWDIGVFNGFKKAGMSANDINGHEDTICYDGELPHGSNDMVVFDKKDDLTGQVGGTALHVYPHPLPVGAQVMYVDLSTPAQAEVDIAITDLMGRQYVNSHFALELGIHKLPIELTETNLPAGVYMLSIIGLKEPANMILIVK